MSVVEFRITAFSSRWRFFQNTFCAVADLFIRIKKMRFQGCLDTCGRGLRHWSEVVRSHGSRATLAEKSTLSSYYLKSLPVGEDFCCSVPNTTSCFHAANMVGLQCLTETFPAVRPSTNIEKSFMVLNLLKHWRPTALLSQYSMKASTCPVPFI